MKQSFPVLPVLGGVAALALLAVGGSQMTQVKKPVKTYGLVLIDPGHSSVEPGVKGGGNFEHAEALKMSLTLKFLLEQRGIGARLTHSGNGISPGIDSNAEIRGRVKLVKELKPDVFISIHYNMVGSYGLVYQPLDKRPAAVRLTALVNEKTGLRRIWSSSASNFGRLGILDDHDFPACLWEVAAIEDAQDSPEWRSSMAKPVCDAIAQFLAVDA